ncbi:hypothetical protein Bbelb_157630 [Branchiostoma belcheri]|nr:hypothetical protein Bbelb_157630 [Branchiostoma belcheri]
MATACRRRWEPTRREVFTLEQAGSDWRGEDQPAVRLAGNTRRRDHNRPFRGQQSKAGGVVSSGRSLGDIFAAFRAAPPQGSISPSQAADLDYVDRFQSGRTYNYYISTVY